ncbi:hypothetical protein EX30DRAFT_351256 [Ascodesmis nigricans]|uniref:Uncharacterized protein n=1 Tax=Ascodesmis nigricans TaxID=341454 RepID=A0A4V6RHC1_9PEZI|nr:hypothetical protein EX30DRAFT_351256 [Ascodesmis nigricans]
MDSLVILRNLRVPVYTWAPDSSLDEAPGILSRVRGPSRDVDAESRFQALGKTMLPGRGSWGSLTVLATHPVRLDCPITNDMQHVHQSLSPPRYLHSVTFTSPTNDCPSIIQSPPRLFPITSPHLVSQASSVQLLLEVSRWFCASATPQNPLSTADQN